MTSISICPHKLVIWEAAQPVDLDKPWTWRYRRIVQTCRGIGRRHLVFANEDGSKTLVHETKDGRRWT